MLAFKTRRKMCHFQGSRINSIVRKVYTLSITNFEITISGTFVLAHVQITYVRT